MEITLLDESSSYLLENVADDVFDNAIDPSSLAAFLACPRHVMLLAVHEGLVVGMASGLEYFHPDKPSQLWINELGVALAYRNQGIGRMLINQLISLAQKRGCVGAWVGTEKTNVAANRCYSSVPSAERPQDFVLYEWAISQDQNNPT